MNELLLCEEIRIVGCVDALSGAKDAVGCRKATPQDGTILNIIDPDMLVSFHGETATSLGLTKETHCGAFPQPDQ